MLQEDATSGNGVEVSVPTAGGANAHEHVFYIRGRTGTTAGGVTLETAAFVGDTGTWSAIADEVTVVADETTAVSLRGLYLAVRARITTAVVGGSVDVAYAGG